MYDCPIKLITSEVIEQLDGNVLAAIQKARVSVDRDELIKALKYDRDQYMKGFADGIKSVERYHWHDLRKKPGDLPPEKCCVDIAYFLSRFGKVAFTTRAMLLKGLWWETARFSDKLYPVDAKVIAWRFIDYFDCGVE